MSARKEADRALLLIIIVNSDVAVTALNMTDPVSLSDFKMYAYVRYTEDNVRKTVPTHYIENFHPKNVNDFNVKKRYRILWKRTPEESGTFYDGQILKLAGKVFFFFKVKSL